jgi:hypothetical protein
LTVAIAKPILILPLAGAELLVVPVFPVCGDWTHAAIKNTAKNNKPTSFEPIFIVFFSLNFKKDIAKKSMTKKFLSSTLNRFSWAYLQSKIEMTVILPNHENMGSLN